MSLDDLAALLQPVLNVPSDLPMREAATFVSPPRVANVNR